MSVDKKSILRGALAVAEITELEAFILIQEIFEEEKAASPQSSQDKDK